jgi:hypothetical protein
MIYVYIRSETQLWTVGYYGPADEWRPESDYDNADEAANRVAYLNGDSNPLTEVAPDMLEALKKFVATWDPDKGRNQREKLDVARTMAERAIEKAGTPKQQQAETSVYIDGWSDVLFIRRLQARLSHEQVVMVLSTIDHICKYCWDDDAGCQCWNDE